MHTYLYTHTHIDCYLYIYDTSSHMKQYRGMLELYFRQTSAQKSVSVQELHNFGCFGSATMLAFKATSDRKNDLA